jgi:2-methylcitrate dehydratase PrpD
VRALAARVRYVIDPGNPYPRQFTGHVRATLRDGTVREARQGHFRGGREAPMSRAALEEKFIANCVYGGWSEERAGHTLGVLRTLLALPRIELGALRG